MENAKRVADSLTEQVHMLMSPDINGQGRLFGGQLLRWIDEVAGVTARRHCGRNVTTAAIAVIRKGFIAVRVSSAVCRFK